MRTIKFRGKSLAKGEWVYGDLQTSHREGKCIIHWYNKDIDRYWHEEVDPATVGQFTGLHDKDGRDIYEGDLITHGDRRILYVVEWQPLTGLVAKQIGSSSYAGLSYWQPVSEVIGNIYDNPELIKQ